MATATATTTTYAGSPEILISDEAADREPGPAARSVTVSSSSKGYATDEETRDAIRVMQFKDAADEKKKAKKQQQQQKAAATAAKRKQTASERQCGVTKTHKRKQPRSTKGSVQKGVRSHVGAAKKRAVVKTATTTPDTTTESDEEYADKRKAGVKTSTESSPSSSSSSSSSSKAEKKQKDVSSGGGSSGRKRARSRSPTTSDDAKTKKSKTKSPSSRPADASVRRKQTEPSKTLLRAEDVGRIPHVPMWHSFTGRNTQYVSNPYDISEGTTFVLYDKDVPPARELADVLYDVTKVATNLLSMAHTASHALYCGSANRFGRTAGEVSTNTRFVLNECIDSLEAAQRAMLRIAFDPPESELSKLADAAAVAQASSVAPAPVVPPHLSNPPPPPPVADESAEEFASLALAFSQRTSS